VTLPIAATIRSEPAPGLSSHWRDAAGGANALVGHFGTYGDHVARDLEPALDGLLAADRRVRCLLVGRGSDGFAAAFAAAHPRDAGRVVASGAVPADEVAAALQACDVLMQPYPDGVTTRRTSVMAGLAAGVATVTTAGRLTERVWRETDAAVLVPASAASPMRDAVIALLSDDAMRRAQAQKGKQTYDERFGIERAVDALLGA
jgi:glycosyltransferase involved in cell wall biosynthesis